MRRHLAALCILCLWAGVVRAQAYAGTFTATNAAGKLVTLTLQQDAQGGVSGTIATDEMRAQVSGSPEDDAVVGVVRTDDDALYFQAELDGNRLILVLVEADAEGNPRYDSAQELVFNRQGAGGEIAAAVEPRRQPVSAAGEQQPLGDGSPLANEWVSFLAGKKVTTMSRYSSGDAGGYTSRTDVFLCSTGEFVYRDQSSVSVDVGGASGYSGGNQSNTGRWRIITQGQIAGIELKYNDGRVAQHRLDHQNGATYADGERVYVTAAEVCQ